MSAELVLIPALNLVGQPVSALERAATVLPRLADHPAFNEYVVGQLETALPTGHRYAGDLDAAEEAAQLAYERVTLQGAGLLRGVYALRLGQITLWRGALGRAEQYFLEAVTALEGDAMTRASAVDHIRYTRALLGRSDMPSRVAPGAMYAVEHEFLSSAVEAAAGDSPTLARSPSARPGGDSRPATSPTHFRPVRGGAARGGARGRRRARRAAGDRGAAAARSSPPPSRHWPSATATGWPRSGAGSKSWAASCHAAELTTAAATVAAGRGQRTAAARLRTRAQQLVERCDGATTELLRSRGGDGLTNREREVAGFAARGLTDLEIAARLSLSRRTVETHLYRIYAKLGISGRVELRRCCRGRRDSGPGHALGRIGELTYAPAMDRVTAQELMALAERLRDRTLEHADVLEAIEARYPEMLAALDWLVAEDRQDEAFSLADDLVGFWIGTGRIEDGDGWFRRARHRGRLNHDPRQCPLRTRLPRVLGRSVRRGGSTIRDRPMARGRGG